MEKKNLVYILRSSKDGRFYIGQTDCLIERLSAHNRGSVKSTKNRRPLELVYFETYNGKSEAVIKEAFIKSQKNTRRFLETVLDMAPSSNG